MRGLCRDSNHDLSIDLGHLSHSSILHIYIYVYLINLEGKNLKDGKTHINIWIVFIFV